MSLEIGDKVRFNYNGSQTEFLGTQEGEVIAFVPVIQWQGGTVYGDEPILGEGNSIAGNVEKLS